MDEAGDIVWISIPFVTGVAAAAVTSTLIVTPEPVSGVVLILSAITLVRCCSSACKRIDIALLFFLTGYFCGLNGILMCHSTSNIPERMSGISTIINSSGYDRERTSALVEALLTGRRSGLDHHTREMFRASGASHLLALSGLHLGVIYLLLGKLLAFMGKGRAATLARSSLTVILCGGYAFLTGASASIIRAFIFILINEAASLKVERRRNPLCTFCAAATLQLSFNPMLITSASFQLSYLAMLGIIVAFPVLDGWYPQTNRLDPVRRVWTSMAMSISCQLFTAPLVWVRFHSFPHHFLLTNLIAMPLTETIIVASVISTALSAAGATPQLLVNLTDRLSTLLLESLETISSM